VDKVDQLIEDIRVELDRLTGGKWPAKHWVVGKLKKDEHAMLPRIEWEEAGGAIGIGRTVGGNTGNIATDTERFLVTIWHSSKENCRNTMHNLLLAARQSAFGPNVVPGAYDWVEDAHLKSGRKLTLAIGLTIPVGTEVHPEAAIASQGHEVMVGSEVIC
jgi:hypothetical protein